MLKYFGVAALMAVFCFVHSSAQANVTGEGDVTPVGPVDLPIGGTIPGETTADVVVGGSDLGFLTIDAPAFTDPLVTVNGEIGGSELLPNEFFGFGRVTVSGFDLDRSEWVLSDELSVGVRGVGQLVVLGGGRVTTGIDTLGNSEIFIGEFVDIDNGVPFRSHGTVTVAGVGSQLITETLHLGEEGDGFLFVSDASLVLAEQVFMAEQTGSTGEMSISGQGTRVLIENELEVGHRGNAVLEVRNRAFLRSQSASMGISPGTVSRATVSDQSSVWSVTNTLAVGSLSGASVGQLYINNSGLVDVGGAMTVFENSLVDLDADDLSNTGAIGGTLRTATLANSGIVRGHGRIEAAITNSTTGEIRNASDLSGLRQQLLVTGAVTNAGVIESLGGEMAFESNVTNSGNIVGRDAVLRFHGGLVTSGGLSTGGATTVYGNITNTGEFLVLPEDTTLLIGNFTAASSGLLSMFIDGDDSSRLAVDGSVSLAGAIDIAFLDGFTIESDDSFELISATGGVSGTFGTELFPQIPGLSLELDYQPNRVVLNVVALDFLQADFDSDGDVDGVDLSAWVGGFGTTPGAQKTDGDANLDGDVDGGDFLSWQRQFNLPPPLSAVASVPEPGSLVLVFSAVLLGWRRRV